jgi:hypothetical protein
MVLYTFTSPELAAQVPSGPALRAVAPRPPVRRTMPAQAPRRLAALYGFAGG